MTHTFKTFFTTYFHIITGFVLLTAALFFTIGELMGAVSLRERYTSIGIGFGISCLLWLVLAFKHERLSGLWILLYLLAIIGVFGIGAFIGESMKLNFALTILPMFLAIGTGAIIIPPYLIAIVIIGTSITQIILSYGKKQNPLKKGITGCLLLYCAGYFIGYAVLPPYNEAEILDRGTYNNQQYFLYIWYGWLSDPDTLLLYECNSAGIFCQVIYQAPDGHYKGRDISIAVDSQAQIVGVRIDDQFSPDEFPEAHLSQ